MALQPGSGHPVHKVEDPRTPVLLQIAEEEGLRKRILRLFEAVGRVHEQVLAVGCRSTAQGMRRAPADLVAAGLLRGFALLGRAAGLLAARRRTSPAVGMDVYLAVDRGAYLNPLQRRARRIPLALSSSRRRTHGHRRRRHRLDAPPLLLPREHVDGPTARRSPTSGSRRSSSFGRR